MALSLMTDPFFDQFFGGGLSRGRGRDLGSLAPTTGSFPALHISCDVVEHPDRYSIIAGLCAYGSICCAGMPSASFWGACTRRKVLQSCTVQGKIARHSVEVSLSSWMKVSFACPYSADPAVWYASPRLHMPSLAIFVGSCSALSCRSHISLRHVRALEFCWLFLLTVWCPAHACADAPGMTSDDIHVELHEGMLKVSGEKSRQHEEGKPGHKVWRQERSFQKFQRCFTLPEDANPETINAKLEHGVLTVEVGCNTVVHSRTS